MEILDVSTRSVHAPSYRKQALLGAGGILELAETSKQKKYADIVK